MPSMAKATTSKILWLVTQTRKALPLPDTRREEPARATVPCPLKPFLKLDAHSETPGHLKYRRKGFFDAMISEWSAEEEFRTRSRTFRWRSRWIRPSLPTAVAW